jgi:hypothetical protein
LRKLHERLRLGSHVKALVDLGSACAPDIGVVTVPERLSGVRVDLDELFVSVGLFFAPLEVLASYEESLSIRSVFKI